jgi:Ca2+-binding EF-hand superfamily protein
MSNLSRLVDRYKRGEVSAEEVVRDLKPVKKVYSPKEVWEESEELPPDQPGTMLELWSMLLDGELTIEQYKELFEARRKVNRERASRGS